MRFKEKYPPVKIRPKRRITRLQTKGGIKGRTLCEEAFAKGALRIFEKSIVRTIFLRWVFLCLRPFYRKI